EGTGDLFDGAATFGDVLVDADVTDDLAGATDRRGDGVDPVLVAGGGEKAKLQREVLMLARGPAPGVEHVEPILGMQGGGPAGAEALLFGETGDPLPGPVGVEAFTVHV